MDVATTMILTLGPVIDFLLANQNALEPRNINWAKAKKMLKNMRVKTRLNNMEFKIIALNSATLWTNLAVNCSCFILLKQLFTPIQIEQWVVVI
ncbi:hypothetical protein CsSME_00031313 [Camellia sinensis var. sinensis]